MFIKLSDKAKVALDQVVQRFRQGDLGPLVDVIKMRIRLPEDAPARRWSFSNQVLAYASTGSLDCRGYRQWQEVGRQVQKGSHGGYILGPCHRTVEDKVTGESKTILTGFVGISVHPLQNTEGEPVAEYEPQEPPPLLDVAQRMGVSVTWQPLPLDRNGDYSPGADHINVGTHDPKTFCHELAHAAHKRVRGELKGGQDTQQEAVAELAATVLMHLYALGDRSGNCWRYVSAYTSDPLRAIQEAMNDVEKILCVLLDPDPAETPTAQ